MTMETLTADDFGAQYDADRHFAFIETDDAMIMAWGHRDADSLLDEVFAYDTLLNPGKAERGDLRDIQHVWAVQVEEGGWDGEWWVCWSVDGEPVTADTPGAFPITVWAR